MIKNRKSVSRVFNLKIIFILLPCMLVLLGAGYGTWSGIFVTTGSVSTGSLDVRFSGSNVENYNMDANGKLLNIHLSDIQEGQIGTGVFFLHNNSSIPVICEAVIKDSSSEAIDINVDIPVGTVIESAGDMSGNIIIKVDNGAKPQAYSQKVTILLRQHNGSSWTNSLDVIVHFNVPKPKAAEKEKQPEKSNDLTVAMSVYSQPLK